MSLMPSPEPITTQKHLCIEACNNRLIVAVLKSSGKSGGLFLPDFEMYRRDRDFIESGLDFIESVTGCDMSRAREEYGDGYWDAKSKSIRPFTLAIVVGENPRLDYLWDGPRFGDVLLISQMASTEYHSTHKLGADTTTANEILIRNFSGDRSVAVSVDAALLATPLEDVIGIVARHSEIKDWANHGCRTDHVGGAG